MVILGHLWVHVSETEASIVLSGDAVALFLMLSGYGLTISCKNRPVTLKYFLSRRIKRVMVPYWMATIFLIFLDYLILDKVLSYHDIIMTILGINVNENTIHVDYVRWYITFLLMWYFIFYCVMLKVKHPNNLLIFLTYSTFLMLLSYYFLRFGWYEFFAFPIGCSLAVFHNEISLFFINKKSIFPALIGVIYILLFKFLYSNHSIQNYLGNHIPNIFLNVVFEFNSIILCFCLIIIVSYFGLNKYRSKILLIFGKYSYEMFLLHGAFLVKYNPIIKTSHIFGLLVSFALFIMFILLLSFLLNKIASVQYEKIFIKS